MALSPSQVRAVLNRKRDEFTQFDQTLARDFKRYLAQWQAFTKQALDTAVEQVNQGVGEMGARPLEGFNLAQRGILKSGLAWDNREQSLAWVRDQITNVTTFAVDGSQVFPDKDLSLPVALIQIGWYENCHTADGAYRKDIRLDVMTPADLRTTANAIPTDRQVNIRRFQMETQRLVEYIQTCKHPERTLVFFDGSLVVTFADAFDAESREAYLESVLALLTASQTYRVPLVGYIDTSRARDLTTLLQKLYSLPETEAVHDAQVLASLMAWGDRSPLFICDREKSLEGYRNHRNQITFTYLKTTREGRPARLELPRWIWEQGLFEQVMDWVRAEVIIGGGYPYTIETADQTAVLQTQDRQVFYRILQDWAETEDINLRLSRKMVSKVRRR